MITSRRSFLIGLVAAPAVLKLGLWMPIRPIPALPTLISYEDGKIFEFQSARSLNALLSDELLGLLSSKEPLFYNHQGFGIITEAARSAVAKYSPAQRQTLIDQSFRFVIDAAK